MPLLAPPWLRACLPLSPTYNSVGQSTYTSRQRIHHVFWLPLYGQTRRVAISRYVPRLSLSYTTPVRSNYAIVRRVIACKGSVYVAYTYVRQRVFPLFLRRVAGGIIPAGVCIRLRGRRCDYAKARLVNSELP